MSGNFGFIPSTPQEEINRTFKRTENENLSKKSSVAGRVICLLSIVPHIVKIGAAPIMYLTAAMASTVSLGISKLKGKKEEKNEVNTILNHLRCMAISPVGEAAQVCKAVAGVVLPGAYFKAPKEKNIAPLFQVVEHKAEQALVLTCDIGFPSAHPEAALKAFLDTNNDALEKRMDAQIKYPTEAGGDLGGLKRDYIFKTFAGLSKKYSLESMVPQFSENKVPFIKDIGAYFQTQLERFDKDRPNRFPIGEVFCPAFFRGVFAFNADEISPGASFDSLTPKRFIEIAISSLDGPIVQILTNFQDLLEADAQMNDEEIDKYTGLLNDLELLDYNIPSTYYDDEGKIDLSQLDEIKEFIVEEIKADRGGAIQTLHVLASSIYSTDEKWDKWQGDDPIAISEYIQGRFNRDDFTNAISMDPRIPQERQAAIRKWIDDKSDDELKQFVKNATGASVLPVGGTIQFSYLEEGGMHFSTCGLNITIPDNLDDELIIQGLENAAAENWEGFNEF